MTTDTREALAALPPLPKAYGSVHTSGRYGREWYLGEPHPGLGGTAIYTAEQMQAYARAALATQPAQPSAQGEAVAWKIITVGGRTFFEDKSPQDCYSSEWLERCQLVQPLYASAPAAPSSCGWTDCKNMPKCDFCKAWDSMGI